MLYVAFIVLILSFLNLLRMGIFLIGSDIYDIKQHKARKANGGRGTKRAPRYRPLISVLVPAHNEELSLLHNLESISESTYKNIELIVINDSSTDRTQAIARNFQRKARGRVRRIRVLNVQVRGKASALNAGLKIAKGSLFMCLDADSVLAPDAIENAVNEFRDRRVAGISSNVRIFAGKGLLNFIQQIEYLIGYQGKKTEAIGGIQYIVGGVGSTYRTRLIRQIGGYDTDTITEDIDLSMKVLSRFGNRYRLSYSPAVISYTEAVTSVRDLLRQRQRWKYGRYQAYLKHRQLFWSRHGSHNRLLSWLYLPYGLFSEAMFFMEPLVFVLIAYIVISYGDPTMLAASFLIFSFYVLLQVSAASVGYTTPERVKLAAGAPIAYFGMYILAFVEYCATIYGLLSLRKIFSDYRLGNGASHWTHVERTGNGNRT